MTTKDIDKTIKRRRSWLKKNGSSVLEQETEFLLEDIHAERPRFNGISLSGFMHYFGALGTIALVDGQKSGWQSVSTAIDFCAWDLKLRSDVYFQSQLTRNISGDNGPSLTNYVSRVACLVCVSEKWEQYAENILRHVVDDVSAVNQEFWDGRSFEPFVFQCCRIRDGEVPDVNFGAPYAAILTNWEDEVALGAALDFACEYHCTRMYDTGRGWYPEFENPPFDMLPCEVMLVRRVRKHLGLPMPEVSHPLVSLLGDVGNAVPLSTEHELIQKLSDRYERYYS